MNDLRLALRQLAKSPGFTAVVVLSLALGIGANTAIFSLVNEFLLRALPVKNPEELVLFRHIAGAKGGRISRGEEGNSQTDPATGRYSATSFSLLTFERFRAHHPALSDVFAYAPFSGANVLIDGQPETDVSAQFVSGGYHTGLGVRAALGRILTEQDDRPGAEPVAVISHRYWQKRFGGDPSVLGRTMQVNKISVPIVGVTAAGFNGALQAGEAPGLSVALAHVARFQPDQIHKQYPWFWWVRIMGRLAPGTTAAQARASLEPTLQQTAHEGWLGVTKLGGPAPLEPDLPTLVADPGAQGETDTRRRFAQSLHILMGLVSLVLFAACANVANLLLARGAARRRELAVRLALGATRSRLVRQLLVEALLLGLLGAALGLLLAWWSRDLVVALRPFGNVAAVLDLPLDGRVLGFTIAAALGTALLFGLIPALRATRLDLNAEFQGGTRTLGAGGRSRLSQTLMVVQIALSLVLLVSTGLFVRTLRNLQNVDTGFNRQGLVLFRIDALPAGYKREQFVALQTRLRERLENLPGIRGATYASVALLNRGGVSRAVNIEGYTPSAGGSTSVAFSALAPNFFATMEMPLVLGRGFTEHDTATAPKVAVIDQAFAQKYFGAENPIGRRLGLGPQLEIEIVGVVRDASYSSLRAARQPTLFVPALQQIGGTANFALRTSGDPAAIFPAIRAAVREIDATLPVIDLRTQEEQIDRLNAQELLFARLSGFFGLLALALACVGLYGLMSYGVLRRTGEIGLRMALGALPTHVLRMILRESLALVAIGIGLGLAAAAAASRLVTSMLFGLSPTDPATYGTVALLLVVIATIATLLPARRAAKIDPMVALRAE